MSETIAGKADRLVESGAVVLDADLPDGSSVWVVTGDHGEYRVTLDADATTLCSCPARGECAHGLAVKAASEQERDAGEGVETTSPVPPPDLATVRERYRHRLGDQHPESAVTLFGSSDPEAVLTAATGTADLLTRVIRERGLVARIRNREHVLLEGWTLLGSLVGVFPVTVWTRPMVDGGNRHVGWEARVEARTRSGEVVGAAEAECLTTESQWRNRHDYALRSMAQTRAASKALRLPLGFIVQLAGFNPTPADEMPQPAVSETESNTAKRAVLEATGGDRRMARALWADAAAAYGYGPDQDLDSETAAAVGEAAVAAAAEQGRLARTAFDAEANLDGPSATS